MSDKIQILQNELSKVNEWIKFAEQKFTLLSTYYALLITFLIWNRSDFVFLNLNNCDYITLWILLIFILSIIVWITFLLISVYPNINTNNLSCKNFFYFWSISSMEIWDFIKWYKKLSNTEKEKQILEQIYINSTIANYKMKNIKKSSLILWISIILFVILIFTL